MIASTEFVRKIVESWGTDATDADRALMLPVLSPNEVAQLKQLAQPVWDGGLLSKSARTELVNKGLVERFNGLNFATKAGYCVLDTLGILGDISRFGGGLPTRIHG